MSTIVFPSLSASGEHFSLSFAFVNLSQSSLRVCVDTWLATTTSHEILTTWNPTNNDNIISPDLCFKFDSWMQRCPRPGCARSFSSGKALSSHLSSRDSGECNRWFLQESRERSSSPDQNLGSHQSSPSQNTSLAEIDAIPSSPEFSGPRGWARRVRFDENPAVHIPVDDHDGLRPPSPPANDNGSPPPPSLPRPARNPAENLNWSMLRIWANDS
ncbi:hypothetical protein SCHPADRAFT_948433 [Schizopora paradoxa]|uniref:C2H2-type domain-containing protein n=1 Tax=Schizopora paradoxa TaxID=27342 RepID=A0A0H2QWP5_9AGAM|nr:hypothetical protein SCHPADRAFT_948433 [Schizopora paradoxa]